MHGACPGGQWFWTCSVIRNCGLVGESVFVAWLQVQCSGGHNVASPDELVWACLPSATCSAKELCGNF